MHHKIFKKKGWQFFVNSGEASRERAKLPHVHAKKGSKEVRIFFDGDIEEKRGSANGNDRRELTKIFQDHKKACAKKWNANYSHARVASI